MRRINSEFQTRYVSEEGHKLTNRDYFGFVEMDDFACYALADSLDEDMDSNSAKYVVESIVRSFVEHPTMSSRKLKSYIQQAHYALMKERAGMRLKASVVLVVTDYRKIRYCHVGNSRFYLIRNGRFLEQTNDQSLTQNLIQSDRLSMDQAAIHEERNNLYSYLGEHGRPDVRVSKKVRLEDGDILAQLTRGIWENCSDGELLQAIDNAKEPQDIINQTEDIILGKQNAEGGIDNYSLAITLINKVYQSPKKRITLKQVLMVVIPILIAIAGLSVVFYLRYRSIKNKQISLASYMDSGETYLQYDNYKKAAEEYTEAKRLASDLKQPDELSEADEYLKLTEQILLADEALGAEHYVKAQELYLVARDLSVDAGNVGKRYIELQLQQTRDYIELYDWISVGVIKEEYGDLEGAVAAYKTAREKASSLYAMEIKEEALQKQTAAEAKIADQQKAAKEAEAAAQKAAQTERDEQRAEEKAVEEKEKEAQAAEQELKNQQKANDQQNAIDLENKGNELMAAGQYDYAITFYHTAQAIYYRMELWERGNVLEEKIKAATAGIEARKAAEEAAALLEIEKNKVAGPGWTEEKE